MQKMKITRYTDSPDSDWIIDVHPSDPGLVLATAGSGHAYKVRSAQFYQPNCMQ